MAQKRRSLYVLPLIVLVCSVAGGFYGPQVQAESADPSDTAELDQDVASFTKVLALVEQNFAEPVSADKAIYKGAVPGMLRTLDPHSTKRFATTSGATTREWECRSRRAMARPW